MDKKEKKTTAGSIETVSGNEVFVQSLCNA